VISEFLFLLIKTVHYFCLSERLRRVYPNFTVLLFRMEVEFSTSGFLHNTLGIDLSKCTMWFKTINPRLSKLFFDSQNCRWFNIQKYQNAKRENRWGRKKKKRNPEHESHSAELRQTRTWSKNALKKLNTRSLCLPSTFSKMLSRYYEAYPMTEKLSHSLTMQCSHLQSFNSMKKVQ